MSDGKQKDFKRKTQGAALNWQCQDLESLCPLKRSVNFMTDDSYGLNCLSDELKNSLPPGR